MALYLVSATLTLVQPFLIKAILENLEGEDNIFGISSGYGLAVILGCVAFCGATAINSAQFLTARAGCNARMVVINSVFQKILRLSATARRTMNSGEVVTLAGVDSERVMEAYTIGLWCIISPIILTAVCILIGTQMGVYVGLAVAVMSVAIMYVALMTSKHIGIYRRRISKISANRVKLTNEVLLGIRVIKFYAWEDSINETIRQIREQEVALMRRYNYLRLTNAVLMFLAPTILNMVCFLVYILLDNTLDVATAFVILALTNACKMAFSIFANASVAVSEAITSTGRLSDFLVSGEVEEAQRERNLDHEKAIISFTDADFQWVEDTSTPTLSNITFTLQPGTLTVIVGPVGSGKSSLVNAILGEMHQLRGTRVVHGDAAYASQQAWIQNQTVRDNILFGEPYDAENYQRVVKACQLLPDFEMLEQGDQTEIGERGINLSGGQKARVGVARAMYRARNFDFVVLDDPLSALDVHVANAVFSDGLMGIAQSSTRLLVLNSHYHLLQYADRILVMSDGQIVGDGTLEQLKVDFAFLVTSPRAKPLHDSGEMMATDLRLLQVKLGAAVAGLGLTYAAQLTSSFQRMTTLTTQVENIMTCFERIAHYGSLDEEGFKRTPSNKDALSPAWPKTGNVVFENVSMRYREDLPLVLKGVSFSVTSGQKVVIVMDEATANVDQESDKLIQQTMKESFGDGNSTVLCIAHRIETIMDSDKILVLDAGELVEFDSPTSLLQVEGGVFKSLVESGKALVHFKLKFDQSYALESQKVAGKTKRNGAPKRPNVNRAIWESVKQTWGIAFVLHVVSAGLILFQPFLIKAILQNINGEDNSLGISSGYTLAVLLGCTAFVGATTMSAGQFLTTRIACNARMICINSAFRKILRLSAIARRTMDTGEIVTFVGVDSDRVLSAYKLGMWCTISPLMLLVVGVLIGTQMHVIVALVASVAIAIILYASLFMSKMIGAYRRQISRISANRLKVTNEMLQGIRVVKFYRWEGFATDLIGEIRAREIALLRNVYADASVAVVEAITSTSRLSDFLAAGETTDNIQQSEDLTLEIPPQISIENADFKWEEDASAPTLANINVSLQPGTLTVVVGPVGSGKSSLVNAILGEMPQTRGKRLVRGNIAYASQQAWIQNQTVRENILFGEPHEAEHYQRVVSACQLAPDFKMLEHGDQTEIGERGINLSGGQKARIAVARAMYRARNFDFVVLDDPLSALDVHVANAVFSDGLMGIASETTRLLVLNSHYHLLQHADRVLVMSGGQIDGDGTLMELQDKFSFLRCSPRSRRSSVEDPAKYEVPGAVEDDEKSTQAKLIVANNDAVKASSSGKLTTLEDRLVGSVKLQSYTDYLACSEWDARVLCGLMIALFTIAQVVLFGCDWFLSLWSQVDNPLPYWGLWLALCIFQVASSFIVCAVVNPFVLIVYVPVGYGCWFAAKVYRASARELKRLDGVSRSPFLNLMSETISGIETVRSYKMVDAFASRCEELLNKNIRVFFLAQVSSRWFDMRSDWLVSVIIGAVAILAVAAKSTVGASVAGLGLTYAAQLSSNFQRMTTLATKVESSMTCFERIAHYGSLDEEGYKLIVMDEATANVDQESDKLIQQTMKESFGGGNSTVCASPRSNDQDSDKILVLDAGEVAEFDSPSALLQIKASAVVQPPPPPPPSAFVQQQNAKLDLRTELGGFKARMIEIAALVHLVHDKNVSMSDEGAMSTVQLAVMAVMGIMGQWQRDWLHRIASTIKPSVELSSSHPRSKLSRANLGGNLQQNGDLEPHQLRIRMDKRLESQRLLMESVRQKLIRGVQGDDTDGFQGIQNILNRLDNAGAGYLDVKVFTKKFLQHLKVPLTRPEREFLLEQLRQSSEKGQDLIDYEQVRLNDCDDSVSESDIEQEQPKVASPSKTSQLGAKFLAAEKQLQGFLRTPLASTSADTQDTPRCHVTGAEKFLELAEAIDQDNTGLLHEDGECYMPSATRGKIPPAIDTKLVPATPKILSPTSPKRTKLSQPEAPTEPPLNTPEMSVGDYLMFHALPHERRNFENLMEMLQKFQNNVHDDHESAIQRIANGIMMPLGKRLRVKLAFRLDRHKSFHFGYGKQDEEQVPATPRGSFAGQLYPADVTTDPQLLAAELQSRIARANEIRAIHTRQLAARARARVQHAQEVARGMRVKRHEETRRSRQSSVSKLDEAARRRHEQLEQLQLQCKQRADLIMEKVELVRADQNDKAARARRTLAGQLDDAARRREEQTQQLVRRLNERWQSVESVKDRVARVKFIQRWFRRQVANRKTAKALRQVQQDVKKVVNCWNQMKKASFEECMGLLQQRPVVQAAQRLLKVLMAERVDNYQVNSPLAKKKKAATSTSTSSPRGGVMSFRVLMMAGMVSCHPNEIMGQEPSKRLHYAASVILLDMENLSLCLATSSDFQRTQELTKGVTRLSARFAFYTEAFARWKARDAERLAAELLHPLERLLGRDGAKQKVEELEQSLKQESDAGRASVGDTSSSSTGGNNASPSDNGTTSSTPLNTNNEGDQGKKGDDDDETMGDDEEDKSASSYPPGVNQALLADRKLVHELILNPQFQIPRDKDVEASVAAVASEQSVAALAVRVREAMTKAFWDRVIEANDIETLLARTEELRSTFRGALGGGSGAGLGSGLSALADQVDSALRPDQLRELMQDPVRMFTSFKLAATAFWMPLNERRRLLERRLLVVFLAFALDKVDELRSDVLNAHLGLLGAYLQRHGVDYEQKQLQTRLSESGSVDAAFPMTTKWLLMEMEAYLARSEVDETERGRLGSYDGAAFGRFVRASIWALVEKHIDGTASRAWPETFELDVARVRACRDALDRIAVVSSLLALVQEYVGRRSLAVPAGFFHNVGQQLSTLLRSPGVSGAQLAAQATHDVRQLENSGSQDAEEELQALEKRLLGSFAVDNPVFKLFFSRAARAFETALTSKARLWIIYTRHWHLLPLRSQKPLRCCDVLPSTTRMCMHPCTTTSSSAWFTLRKAVLCRRSTSFL
ncbi:P-loop containing nucleoside triphosphate hydrolase [Phytophthora cactorum]|nr:P-loop containing nucleoside triphosphate hydrolase [Phytophthora cactorum]